MATSSPDAWRSTEAASSLVVATEARPAGATAARNWDRIANDRGIIKVHAPVARDVAVFGQGIDKAAVIVDALLGSGSVAPPGAGAIRRRGHRQGAPCRYPGRGRRHALAVDLSSGEPSDPAVVADLTVTFHRPKTGLLTRRGAAYAGRILVAPIGIPAEADRG